MSIFAARAGAKHVYGIDFANIAKNVSISNKLFDVEKFIDLLNHKS